jgi:hypothetical protein
MPDPDRTWAKAAVWLLVIAWVVGTVCAGSLPSAMAGIELILLLGLAKNWFGIRNRLPVLSSSNPRVAMAAWLTLLLLGIVVFWATTIQA